MTSKSGVSPDKITFAPVGDISTRAAWRFAIIGSLTSAAVLWIFVSIIFRQIDAGEVETLWIDFNPLWTAAFLAVEGRPLDAFEEEIFEALQRRGEYSKLPWLYPPGMMLLLSPLGALPFKWAWITMMVVSLIAIFAALWALTRGRILVVIGFGLALGSLVTLFLGQTSILWVAALVGALVAIRQERFVLAGILIGLLTLKPQLGLLIPIALAAAGLWRTFWSAAFMTIFFAAIPTLIYGFAYWPLLIDAHATQSAAMVEHVEKNVGMVTTHSVLTGLGVNERVAMAAQLTLLLIAAVFVWQGWGDPSVNWALKSASLMTATAVALPYFWYYETVILIPAGLLLLYAGALKGKMGSLLLVLMWTGAGPLMVGTVIAAAIAAEEIVMPIRNFMLPLCLAAFYASYRAVRETKSQCAL